MSETAKIRLVRCPKCENLLPEVPDYSVYQCGGCGAVLRAKNKGVRTDAISEKSDEGRIVGTGQKLTDGYHDDNDDDKMANVSEKRATMEMSDGSESDVRSSISSSSRAKTRVLHKENLITEEESIVVSDNDEHHQTKISRSFGDLANEDERIREKGEVESFWRARGMDNEAMDRAKEGPSNILSRPSYGNENLGPDRNVIVDEFTNADRERVELLKKLDELKDQLSRSGNLIDKGKEKILHERRTATAQHDPYWHPDPSLEMNRVLLQNPYPNPHFVNHHYTEPPVLMHRQETRGRGFYPPSHHVPGYGDPAMPQIHRRGPYAPYQTYPSRTYQGGPYQDDGMLYTDPMDPYPYPPSFSRHHPSCSCYQCRQKRFGYHENPNSFNARDYNNHRLPDPHPAIMDGFVHRRPPRVHPLSIGKQCRPMAGGAPFLTCYNCFELLLLPKRVMAKDNDRKKMRCGACSTLIIFMVSDGNLVVSYDVEAKDDCEEVEDVLPMHGRNGKHLNKARTTFSSEDYDNYGYDFNSTGRANGSTESNNRHSTSTYASEVDEDWESSLKNKADSPPSGSSLQDHFEHSNKYNAANRSRDGNRSGRSEHEKQLPNKTTGRQISGKESSSATEIDLSSNEFGNTGTTFDSMDGTREGDQLKVSKGAESFFAGIIKKSFKDKSNDDDKASVTINSHPIPSRVVKKAEKVAGSIHPGHYWYDYRAGFWGVMGGPCLGIIPPFIEEFNHRMPENCAGGNTGVFVNGRELNQKDLTLLGSRGLPIERDRSYFIEISGRVIDEDTGRELDGLGKLAPTVERMKRGFGMKPPKAAT